MKTLIIVIAGAVGAVLLVPLLVGYALDRWDELWEGIDCPRDQTGWAEEPEAAELLSATAQKIESELNRRNS